MGFLDAVVSAADVLITAAIILLEAWLLVHAARRVLGVPVGWFRSLAISAIVVVSLVAVSEQVILAVPGMRDSENAVATLLIQAVIALWAFAISAAVLVGLEVLWPSGSLPTLRWWVFGWRRRLREARRSAEISAIAARHGLTASLRGITRPGQQASSARALRNALQDAGPTFVKLGQMLSTRADLLPPPYIRELSQLTNRARPIPWSVARATIESELGVPISDAFAEVEEAPLASASLSQVHAGSFADGRAVVAKVQRPGAHEQVALDLALMRRLAARLEGSSAWARSLGVIELVRGFAASLDEELDYATEVDNMEALRKSCDHRGIRIPIVEESLTTTRLLVMERLSGTPLAQAADMLEGMEPEARRATAQRLLAAILAQVLDDGVFHADLHPGNIVLWPDGTTGLLDFGSVGRIDAASRRSLATLLWAIDVDDPALATDCLLDLLDRPEFLDDRELQRDVGRLLTRYRGGVGQGGSSALFGELFTMIIRHGLRVPPPIAAAFRSLAALEGTLGLLDPSLDLVDSARTVAREVVGDISPESLRDELGTRLLRLVPILERLPRRLDRISDDLAEGRFQVRIRPFADPADRRFLTGVVQQLVLAILSGAAVLGGIMLSTGGGGGDLLPGISVFQVIGYLLAFAGFVLALRAVALIFRPPSD